MSPSEIEEVREELEHVERKLAKLYREEVWPLREKYAQVAPPAALPSPRNRTDKQALIARCPRCGERLKNEEG